MDRWRSFLKTLVITATALIAATYVAVAIIDPYDALGFSPSLARAPVADSQRYAFPALARSADFDSLVIGTSTMRHLPTAELNAALGGRFANLALDDGTAYEQLRLIELFARHHDAPRLLLIGLDVVWCEPAQPSTRTRRDFPEWLYDEVRWNDLRSLTSPTAIIDAWRQLRWLLGMGKLKRGLDGYAELSPPSAWNLARAQERIYGAEGPREPAPVGPAELPSAAEQARWTFPDLQQLMRALAALPQARKVLIFVPYHYFNLPVPGSRSMATWQACKDKVVSLAADLPNVDVLDFMIPSPITRDDANYWDVLHYRVETGIRLIGLIAEALRTGQERAEYFRYLLATGAGGVAAD